MELDEKEQKYLKRLTDSDRRTRKLGTAGGIITMAFSFLFFFIAVYFYVAFLPKFRMVQGAAIDDLKALYTLWCYTFFLLGFSTFLVGYLMLQYCNDIHFLITLRERLAAKVEGEGNNADSGKARGGDDLPEGKKPESHAPDDGDGNK